MKTGGDAGRRYLHGTSLSERRRLEAQAGLLGGAGFLPPLREMRVLDVGCGTGAIAREVAGRVAPGEVVGLDRDPEQLAAARELAEGAGIALTLTLGSVEELPFRDRSFDAAYCRFLLEHLPDPLRAITEMARVVRPGGWICALEWEPDALVMHPACPNVLAVWQAIYAFQAATGVDPRVGRRLYALFQQADLVDVEADTLAWSVTAGQPEALPLYVSGAREIIRQTQEALIHGEHIRPASIELALREYDQVLSCPSTFISHSFCRATAHRA
jgi:ubiquinone/menaquinone biosynthesis C-methylase UbiE